MASEGIGMEHREDWLSNNSKSVIIAKMFKIDITQG